MAKATWTVGGNIITVKGDYSGYGALMDIVAAAFGGRAEIIGVNETKTGAIITVRNKRKDDGHSGPSKKR